MQRKLGTILVAVAVTLPSALLAGGGVAVAKAPRQTIACTLTGNGTVSPGISSTAAAQTITLTTQLTGCTGSIPGITQSSQESGTPVTTTPVSCTSSTTPSRSHSTSVTIDWNNATTSAVKFKLILKGATASLQGKVTSGTFAKEKLTGSVSVAPGAGQNCITTPITTFSVSGSISIT